MGGGIDIQTIERVAQFVEAYREVLSPAALAEVLAQHQWLPVYGSRLAGLRMECRCRRFTPTGRDQAAQAEEHAAHQAAELLRVFRPRVRAAAGLDPITGDGEPRAVFRPRDHVKGSERPQDSPRRDDDPPHPA